jgi:hypothetical protein
MRLSGELIEAEPALEAVNALVMRFRAKVLSVLPRVGPGMLRGGERERCGGTGGNLGRRNPDRAAATEARRARTGASAGLTGERWRRVNARRGSTVGFPIGRKHLDRLTDRFTQSVFTHISYRRPWPNFYGAFHGILVQCLPTLGGIYV